MRDFKQNISSRYILSKNSKCCASEVIFLFANFQEYKRTPLSQLNPIMHSCLKCPAKLADLKIFFASEARIRAFSSIVGDRVH